MKAIVNIGLRKVILIYTIKTKDLAPMTHDEQCENFKDFELSLLYDNKTIRCTHTIWFSDIDEWKSVLLFDGKTIDFHYDFENSTEFKTKKDWGKYIFSGYDIDVKPQLYDNNIVDQVIINF